MTRHLHASTGDTNLDDTQKKLQLQLRVSLEPKYEPYKPYQMLIWLMNAFFLVFEHMSDSLNTI